MTVQDGAVERPGEGVTPPGEAAQVQPDEMARLRQEREELLRMKSNAEATNRKNEELAKQIADLNAQLTTLTTRQQPPGNDPHEIMRRGQQQFLQTYQTSQNEDDRAIAAFVLGMQQQVDFLSGELQRTQGLLKTPEQERADVERIQSEAQKRGEFIGPDTARALLELQRMRQSATSPSAPPSPAAPPVGPPPVVTSVQPVPAAPAQAQRPKTVVEYGQQMREMRERGDTKAMDALIAWRRSNPDSLS